MFLNFTDVMLGYLNRPEANADTIFTDADGTWLKTGDIAWVDNDGYFFITDRLKVRLRTIPPCLLRVVLTSLRTTGSAFPLLFSLQTSPPTLNLQPLTNIRETITFRNLSSTKATKLPRQTSRVPSLRAPSSPTPP